jgi:hypothetical protein
MRRQRGGATDALFAACSLPRCSLAPPASQCVPRSGAIIDDQAVSTRPERCAALVAP